MSEAPNSSSKERIDQAFNVAVEQLGALFAGKQLIREVTPQTLGCERYRLTFSGQRFSDVNVAMHDLGVAIRQWSGEVQPAPETRAHGAGDLQDVLLVAQGGLLTSDKETWLLAIQTVQRALGTEPWATEADFPIRSAQKATAEFGECPHGNVRADCDGCRQAQNGTGDV